eukprot:45938_1
MKHLLSYLLGLVVLTSVVQSDNWFNWSWFADRWGEVNSKDGVKFADRWGEGKKFWDLQFDHKFVTTLNGAANPVGVHVENGNKGNPLQFRQVVVFDEIQQDAKTIIVILQEVQDKYRIGFWIKTADPPTINGQEMLKTWFSSGDKQTKIEHAASLLGVDGTKLARLFAEGIPAKNEVTKPLNLDGRRRLMANEAIDNIIERMRRRRRLKTMEAIREVLRKEDLEF